MASVAWSKAGELQSPATSTALKCRLDGGPGAVWISGNVAAPVAIATVNKNTRRHAYDVIRTAPAGEADRARGSAVFPIRNWSTDGAHWRPSRIAQTTSDCPRRMSPAANSLSREVRY